MSSKIREEIESLISNINIDDNNKLFTAQFTFPKTFTGFKGHFPEQPILPGICQIQAAMTTISNVLKLENTFEKIIFGSKEKNKPITQKNSNSPSLTHLAELKTLKKAKFSNQILPDEIITITGEIVSFENPIDIKFTVTKIVDEKIVTISRLRMKIVIREDREDS